MAVRIRVWRKKWRYVLKRVRWWVCRRVTLARFCERITGQQHNLPWREVIRRDPCGYCGSRDRITLDHVWPRWRRTKIGVTDVGAACRQCNAARADMPLVHYLLWRQTQVPKPLSKNQLRAAKRIEARQRRTRVRPQAPPLRASIGDRVKWKHLGGG